ncbi:MAG TPA: thiamine diphosphokinase [Candidatus Acidoferrales bacterium]|nr:thiamine diphosphokinase [Candidatus Acidoferrales bacterium]
MFCNGDPPSRDRVRNLIPRPTFIACADGGANKSASLGYKPNLVVGDLDSFTNTGREFEDAEIVRIDSQDNTDFEKTLNLLLGRDFREFLVFSFSGGRIDQTLANLQIAYEYSKKCRIVLADNQYLVFPASKDLSLDIFGDVEVSIIPMEDGTTVSTKGLAYGLHGAVLKKGGQGISNRATGDKIEITVHKGGVLVFVKDA